jgi:ribonuclease HI
LPDRIDLYLHGLLERNIASYGFWIWDLADNRLLAERRGIAARGGSSHRFIAEFRAAAHAMTWLLREKMVGRPLALHTDSPTVYHCLARPQHLPSELPTALADQLRAIVPSLSHMQVKLVPEAANARAVQLAAEAYVRCQESRRTALAERVLYELQPIGHGRFRVGSRYDVDLVTGTCTCPDFRSLLSGRFPVRCKHLLAAAHLFGGQG